MRKFSIAITLLGCLGLGSCLAGPQYFRRSIDDFDRKLYVDNPLVDGILWVIPVFPIAYYLSYFVDFFVNGYAFWIKDVWSGEGTGFVFNELEQKKYIKSLVREDSKFFGFEGEGY